MAFSEEHATHSDGFTWIHIHIHIIVFKRFSYTECVKGRGEGLYSLLLRPRSTNDANLKFLPDVYLDMKMLRWKLMKIDNII